MSNTDCERYCAFDVSPSSSFIIIDVHPMVSLGAGVASIDGLQVCKHSVRKLRYT